MLTLDGRCETTRGPGVVRSVRNATRWDPAWVTVELDNGGRCMFRGDEIAAPGEVPRAMKERRN